MSLRVDALPWPLRPWVALYGYVAATLITIVWGLLKLTTRVEHRYAGPAADEAPIGCVWHEALLPYFVACMPYRRPTVWMNHPLWVMKGVHIFLRWMGVSRLFLGSSGHGGRAALLQLVPLVREGQATFLNPDGPRGPPHVLRDGVLDLAIDSGQPVSALRITCSGAVRLPTWDRKIIPLPGSRIVVHHSAPFCVTRANRDDMRRKLSAFLEGRDASQDAADSGAART